MRSDYLRKQPGGEPSTKAPRGLGCKTVAVTVVLVLGVVSTIGIIKVLVGSFWPDETQEAAELDAAIGRQLAAEQEKMDADQDGDGLTDLLENIYRSDPANPDTDGDGTKDGEEVEEGRDPTIKRDPAVAGASDSFDFSAAEGLLAEESYSRKYVATLPADVSREDLLDQDRIAAFVEEVRGELVKTVDDSEITISSASDGKAVAAYLDAVSANTNPKVTTVTNAEIDEAFRLNYQLGQNEEIDIIIDSLQGNVAVLEETAVPQPALELHKRLLGSSRALLENVRLLKRMPDDLVGGLVAAKNIEDLGAEFGQVAQMVARLEQQYGLQ